MKKFYSFALIILSLFSCVVFSACGNKYKNLKMNIFSNEGEMLTVAEFVIDSSKGSTKTFCVEFLGIDKDDIGEIVVSSLPQELITVTNYSYSGNRCYVDITPNMSSGSDAKLVVSHLNSGKKKSINLSIDKKAENLNLVSNSYAIALPQTETVNHVVDFSQIVNLSPSGSTDKIYFKLADGSTLENHIKPINLTDVEGYEDVLTGFEVSVGKDFEVDIYPVTYMKGYIRGETDPYINKKIKIYFKNALSNDNVKIKDDISSLNLIANDESLNLFKVTLLNQNDELLMQTDCVNFYNLNHETSEQLKVSTFIDSNKDVIIKANTHTDDYVDVKIILSPKMPGNLPTVEKIIKVKGESKADTIYVEKFQQEVEDFNNVNIFDYYDDGGNSLGALFTFKPSTNNGSEVHEELKSMQIVIDPAILYIENCTPVPSGVSVDSTLFSLTFNHISLIPNDPFKEADLLKFTYKDGKMVSEEIGVNSRVYIKYIKHASGDGRYEPSSFGIDVVTLNKSENEFWKNLEQTKISLNFNRMEGVAKATLQAGEYYYQNNFMYPKVGAVSAPEYIYLDRLKGLNNTTANRTFVSIINESVESRDGGKIATTDFTVTVEPLQEVENPLKIAFGSINKDDLGNIGNNEKGVDKIVYKYDSKLETDIVSLVFRNNTSLGDYKITFYQENIEKVSLICRVYENLNGINESYIEIETNAKAFKNVNYIEQYQSQYIVASGQSLNLSINLPQAVLNSNIVVGYDLTQYEIKDSLIETIDEDPVEPGIDEEPINVKDYFDVKHDHDMLSTAVLDFKKGTYIKDKPQYVCLTIVVGTKIYSDITQESSEIDYSNIITLTFFIYEEIENKDASINHTSMTRYMTDCVGVYYEDLTKADLKITMADELWNYVTLIDSKQIKWSQNWSEAPIGKVENNDEHSCAITFNYSGVDSKYEVEISAFIQQFDNLFEYKCVFLVEKPILTQKLLIKSDVYESDGELYIDLKKGDTYQVEATNYSKLGDVTFDDIIIQVAAEDGQALKAYDYFEIDRTNSKIKVKDVNSAYNFTLIVFTKDVLSERIESTMSGYENPSSFIKKFDYDNNNYSNAFVKIAINLFDGSVSRPIPIHTYEDFLNINKATELHYVLKNNINLSNGFTPIENFTGSLKSFGNETFTIDGITLDGTNVNLFKDFKGEIDNIKFGVQYAYDMKSSANEVYLGLFNKNAGTLENVKVQMSGSAQLKGSATYIFGGLVGDNHNIITYSSGYGVAGKISITGEQSTTVYFGGLVGRNINLIKGYETSNNQGGTNSITIGTNGGVSHAISMIEATETTLYGESSIGGVVGLNTYDGSSVGTIKNMFVKANIDANASNVGGVIGTNKQQGTVSVEISSNIPVNFDSVLTSQNTKAIYNVKSASTINANNNVGGIVGNDENGVYVECDYQILNTTKNSICANSNVGGIAGFSKYGKFAYCSVMNYNLDYEELNVEDKTDLVISINSNADISGADYVGGIVGKAESSTDPMSSTEKRYDRVIVLYSSVNAYLKATKTDNNIGGILTQDGTKTADDGPNLLLYGVYFIGKLDGNVVYYNKTTTNNGVPTTHYFALDNGYALFDQSYSINIEENVIRCGSMSGNQLMTNWFENLSDDDYSQLALYWGWLKNVNGGHIFITTTQEANSDSLPIFDLAPESITATVVKPKATGLEKVLMLDYYDFSLNSISNEDLEKLNESYNRNQYIIDHIAGNGNRTAGLLNITAKPEKIGNVVVSVRSTDPSVIDINFDGRIIINGVGECELIFSSILNTEAEARIKVVVDYPIGDQFNITKYPNDEGRIVSGTEKIAQGTTKQYYVLTSGSKTINQKSNEKTYSYITKTNVWLDIAIECNDVIIEDYVQISGKTATSVDSKLSIKLDDKTPFTISVLKMLEDDQFTFTIKPFVVVDDIEVYLETVDNQEASTTFNLSTLKGVTGVSFSYDDAIVYPNDTVYLTMQLQTDDPLCPDTTTSSANGDVQIRIDVLKNVISNLLNLDPDTQNLYNLSLMLNNNPNVKCAINVDRSSYNKNTQIQTIVLRIEFEDMNLEEPENMKITLSTLEDDAYAQVNFKIIPQRINKIEVKNYYYRLDDNQEKVLELYDVLKPNDFGLMIIDLVPNNAYYDYLEISDITGNEEIVFIQIDGDGKAYNLQDVSSDGKGIKLYNYNSSRLYVRTQISNTYSSKLHTIEIRAYASDRTQLGDSYRKQIDVRMLPQIDIKYLKPDGSVGASLNSTDNETSKDGLYLATGVDAIFTITTQNADEIIVSKDGSSAGDYEIEKITETQYRLKATNKVDIGNKITLKVKAISEINANDTDETECSITFTIVDFVIHGVSVNSSINNLTTKEIYGYYNRDVKLNFYFSKTDVSYYDSSSTGEKFWDTEYNYGDAYDETDDNLVKIYSILQALNGYDSAGNLQETNDYLILNKNKKETSGQYDEDEILNQGQVSGQKVQLYQNVLTVQEGYDKETVEKDGKEVEVDSPKYLAVAFKLNYDKEAPTPSWELATLNSSIDRGVVDYSYIVDVNFKLNFMNVTQWDNPEVVNNVEDFYNMESGKQYILNTDLTLENHTPIDADLVYFDGNGHTITIHSFSTFEGTQMNAGLFAQVYPNMIVKNVNVKYVSMNVNGNYTFGLVKGKSNGSYEVEYADLSQGSAALTNANFGGVCAVNKGIITNCYVSGLIAVTASALGTSEAMNLGGLVAENSSTGYITNSHSELNMFALANIGGFVNSNNGKIASCGVEENATIYGYQPNLENTITAQFAGFVVQNAGEISMSYVNLNASRIEIGYAKKNMVNNEIENDYLRLEINGGKMSVKDSSAGFVYSNSGNIYDAYVQMTEIGVNNNYFAGFVYSNSGNINRAYTYLNEGKIDISNTFMFAPSKTSGIENSVEFMSSTSSSYNNGIDGLETKPIAIRYSRSFFETLGFAFGDNESAVWQTSAGNAPKLVSAKRLEFKALTINYVPDNDVSDGVDNSRYVPDYGTYGTKENPFIIHDLTTWNRYFDYDLNKGIMTGYYRIVKDIDFASVGKNPSTSELIFQGNIQGNNMQLMNMMLYSNEGLDSLGLFKKLQGVSDSSIQNAVRNLQISATSVWASSTKSVGILAGIIENFNIYNLTIDSEGVIMVGKNAVGGVAGVVRGEFDMDQISSNIGANSTRASTLNSYSIYMSENNSKNASENLSNVYYAGAVAGILDGYSTRKIYNINDERNLQSDYYKVRNVNVSGAVTVAGDTIGGAFGFVGESVLVDSVNVNITGSLFGSQYSAGIVGENRGVLKNAKVVLQNGIFTNAKNVHAGAVGLNIGGLVSDVSAQAFIEKNNYGYVVAGIVGRNINGVVTKVYFDGELYGYITGGIIGTDYDYKIYESLTSGRNSLNVECRDNFKNIVPENTVMYSDDYKHLQEVSIGGETLNWMINNSNRFYGYQKLSSGAEANLTNYTVESKVLGLVVGLSYDNSVAPIGGIYKDIKETKIIFNGPIDSTDDKMDITSVTVNDNNDDMITTYNFNVYGNIELELKEGTTFNFVSQTGDISYVMYLLGSTVASFDSWSTYDGEYLIFGTYTQESIQTEPEN